MPNIAPSLNEQTHDRNSVRDVEQDDTRRNHAIERSIAPQIEQPQQTDNEAADEMGSERNVNPTVHLAEKT